MAKAAAQNSSAGVVTLCIVVAAALTASGRPIQMPSTSQGVIRHLQQVTDLGFTNPTVDLSPGSLSDSHQPVQMVSGSSLVQSDPAPEFLSVGREGRVARMEASLSQSAGEDAMHDPHVARFQAFREGDYVVSGGKP
jgi:hypothetical protein